MRGNRGEVRSLLKFLGGVLGFEGGFSRWSISIDPPENKGIFV